MSACGQPARLEVADDAVPTSDATPSSDATVDDVAPSDPDLAEDADAEALPWYIRFPEAEGHPPQERMEVLIGGARTTPAPPPVAPALDLIRVEPGVFMMGRVGPETSYEPAGPSHEVHITRPFLIGATEVTLAQWQAVMGQFVAHPEFLGLDPEKINHPASCLEPDCAAVGMSWFEALRFCNELSRIEGLETCYDLSTCEGTPGLYDYICHDEVMFSLDCEGYRLPTEAEWEYAARAGATTHHHLGDYPDHQPGDFSYPGIPVPWLDANLSRLAWYRHASNNTVARVAQKEPNAWGLYDTLGNVAEWTWDQMMDGQPPPYDEPPVTDPVSPPTGATEDLSEVWRVCRGCSAISLFITCRLAGRASVPLSYPLDSRDPQRRGQPRWFSHIGLRIVRSL